MKTIYKIVALCTLVFLFLGTSSVRANSDITLVIHYFRYDGDYSNSYMWLWEDKPISKEGSNHKISSETDDYGSVTRVKLSQINGYNAANPPTSIGIIIKQGKGWDEKDVPMDRFIDVTAPDENGEVHAYFVQGEVPIGRSPDDPNGPDRSHKVLRGYFSELQRIDFQLTEPVSSDRITLKKDGKAINTTVNITETKGTISLNERVNFESTYELVVEFSDGTKTHNVTFEGLYDTKEFEEAFYYDGQLGAIYTKEKTTFRLWAPVSKSVSLCLYDSGAPSSIEPGGDDEGTCHLMKKKEKGVWEVTIDGDLHGKYYTYRVTNGSVTHEVVDPYAYSAGVNGLRGMVVDFGRLNPEGWSMEKPQTITNYTDAIIYELHVRDLTSHPTWNGPEEYRGKFLGLTVSGTEYEGVKTGLDHLVELGITHLHLLPVFDFGYVDETKHDDPNYYKRENGGFNWGYMPIHFNVPEGSYSTNPYDGSVRVKEFKQMVQTLHDHGIRVVMDVVYNHTGLSEDSNFHRIVPGYYHRLTETGGFSNGSGTGNETASERAMVRKFIVDSVTFWATEYNIDGFRFDLMALHDVDTMKAIKEALHAIDPTIIIYGEPWMGGSSVMDPSISAGKENIKNLEGIAAFNDEIRDGIKGSVFDKAHPGYVQGNNEGIQRILYGITGGIQHPQVSFENVWHTDSLRTVNYVSSHDNHTLYDKLILSNPQRRDIAKMQKQANAIILTSQGIPFLHAGVDFMRSKGGHENSYNQPDSVNQLDWSLKKKNLEVFNYYKGLIELRKKHPAFRMTNAEEIKTHLTFLDTPSEHLIAFQINDFANGDRWEKIIVIHNNKQGFERFNLPEGDWNVVVDQKTAGVDVIRTVSGTIVIRENETLVLYQGERLHEKERSVIPYIIGGVIGLVAIGGMLGVAFLKKRARLTS